MKIHTQISEGKLPSEDSLNIKKYLRSLSGYITITIERSKKIRSNRQNKYYFGVCVDLISEHTGFSREEVHELLKYKFLGLKEIEIGGKKEILINSTTKLSTQEFENYLEQIKQWSAELGIILPDPNQ